MSASKLVRVGEPADMPSDVLQTNWQRRADWLARVALLILAVDVTLGLVVGSFIAIKWPTLREWGGGFGGGLGLPLLLALVLGVPSLVVRGAGRPLAFVGPLIILFGFGGVSHLLDPCFTGLLDGSSRLGSQPLCEFYTPEWNIHDRFHLLYHAVFPTLALVPLYWFALRKWHPTVTRFR